jgi:hypothetical protein
LAAPRIFERIEAAEPKPYQGDTAGEANEEPLKKTKQTAEQSFQTEPSALRATMPTIGRQGCRRVGGGPGMAGAMAVQSRSAVTIVSTGATGGWTAARAAD